MNQVCLSCLTPMTNKEKSYCIGYEIYHEFCWVSKVNAKALKYANQIKSLEPEQIVAQLYGSDKFKLTDEEIKIIKSNGFNKTDKPTLPKNLQSIVSPEIFELMEKLNKDNNNIFVDEEFSFNNIIMKHYKGFSSEQVEESNDLNLFDKLLSKYAGSEQIENLISSSGFNSQIDTIYDGISTWSGVSDIKNILSKEDFSQIVGTTAQIALSDEKFFKLTLDKANGLTNVDELAYDFELQDKLKSKIFSMLPQELKFKLDFLKVKSKIKLNDISSTDSDTESDNESENINHIVQPDLD